MTWPTIPPILLSAFQLSRGTTIVTAPDGSQALRIGYGGSASVNIGVSPAQLQAYPPGQAPYAREGTYTLSFDVVNDSTNYPGEYDVEIDFGVQKFCELYGWGQEKFTIVTATCPSPAYIIIDKALPGGGPVQGQNNFILNVLSLGWPLLFNNFSLTFTPTN